MLSPTIAANAAIAITSSIWSFPRLARTAAVISAVSPGTGTPLDSAITSQEQQRVAEHFDEVADVDDRGEHGRVRMAQQCPLSRSPPATRPRALARAC